MTASPGACIVFGIVVGRHTRGEYEPIIGNGHVREVVFEGDNWETGSDYVRVESSGWDPYMEYILYVNGTYRYECVNGAWAFNPDDLVEDEDMVDGFKQDIKALFDIVDVDPVWLVCPQYI